MTVIRPIVQIFFDHENCCSLASAPQHDGPCYDSAAIDYAVYGDGLSDCHVLGASGGFYLANGVASREVWRAQFGNDLPIFECSRIVDVSDYGHGDVGPNESAQTEAPFIVAPSSIQTEGTPMRAPSLENPVIYKSTESVPIANMTNIER